MNTGNEFHTFKTNIVILLFWLTGLATAFSQDYLFDTEIINVEDGLPHRMTYYIVQDKEGFIWVNTQGAISRYDGYGFKTYNASFLGIREDKSAEIAIDHANRLWYHEIQTSSSTGGVIAIAKDSIYSMQEISGGLFTSKDIIRLGNTVSGNDEVFIVTRSGTIYTYDGHFEKICHLPFPILKDASLKIHKAAGNSYWITHDKVLFKVKDKKIVKTINLDSGITDIVGTHPSLIVQIADSLMQGSFRRLENDILVPFSILPDSSDNVKKILQWHKDYICYATKDALLVRDKEGKLIYRLDGFDPAGHIQEFTPGITLIDRQNILWITTQNGLVKLIAKKNPFKILFPGHSIRGIFRDKGTLWVGGGPYKSNVPDTIRTEQAFLDPVDFDAMSFHKDLDGHLWIGTQKNKIVEYIPGQDRYIHYTFDSIPTFSLNLPFQNPVTGNHFVAGSGLFRFYKKTKSIVPFLFPVDSKRVNIRHVYQNEQGIWLASNKGIFLMDAQQEIILKHYTTADGLPTNSIRHIHEDNQGVFWLGTVDAGLVRWNLTTNSFRRYTREDELSNNKIYAVYEDDFETLWLPSDYGLMAFDKKTATTQVYLPKDGIAHEEFNRYSYFQDTDGTLYFGGLNGITIFHPKNLRKDANIVFPLYATRVRVLEKDAETFTDKTETFKVNQKIALSPNDRILELELTLLDYESSSQNQYAYKLSGKQEQWVYTRENKLSVINPPYGKYDLVIKARGASGQWSEDMLIIPMHVQPPFYLRWWFILVAVLSGIIIVIITVQWRVQKLKKDRRRLEAEVQKRTWKIAEQAEDLKALDKAKTRFFANITHEFRTPLTLVAGPVEQMIATLPPPATIKKNLSGILKNTRNLMELINQLLDLSKLEGGRMKMEVSHGDIVRYTRELVSRFKPLAAKKQLQLTFKADADVWKIHTDIDKWTKIVHNLLSNAIKFTPKGGRVTVHLEQMQQDNKEYIQLNVKDNGIGIPPENLEHIFDRFYQADASSTRLQGGTGIGLSLVKELVALQNGMVTASSTIGKGSEFTVTLPLVSAPDLKNTNSLTSPEAILLPADHKETQPEKKSSAGNDNIVEDNQEKLELLIIEDSEEMRGYIRSCIDASLYNISEAANGEEGIEKAMEMVPDLIISDVMMPKKNGFELTEAIRRHLATSHIPLILLTAKASLESRLKGLERGADAYLTKPFSPQELVLRIKKLIELRRLLQKRYQNQDEPPDNNAAFKKEDTFINRLRSYILDNISDPDLHAEAISRHFAISRRQLYRKLEALRNMSVRDYVRSVRLDAAWQLLKEQKLNISEIAYETGFSSPSDFSRAFKKAYGKAPSKL